MQTSRGAPASRVALAASAAAMALVLVASRGVRVKLGTEADVTPVGQLIDLALEHEPLPEDGPVLIQIEYRIDPEQRAQFMQSIHALEPIRRRNGASDWRVFRDLAEDGRIVERFIVESWAENVRLRTRMTLADRKVLDAVQGLQRAGVPLRVSRLIGFTRDDEAAAAALR